jgi:hypothetical protein
VPSPRGAADGPLPRRDPENPSSGTPSRERGRTPGERPASALSFGSREPVAEERPARVTAPEDTGRHAKIGVAERAGSPDGGSGGRRARHAV